MIRLASGQEAPTRRARGDLALRRALQALLDARGSCLAASAYGLERDALGCPRLVAPPGGADALVSLSHSGDISLAFVQLRRPGLLGIGIDIERRDCGHEGLLEGGFGEAEARLISAATGTDLPLRAWCAKEAVVKALGTGFREDPWATACVSAGTTRFAFRTPGGGILEARCHACGPWVVARAHHSLELRHDESVAA
jgi:phosphopantetheinyl transferase